MKDENILPGSNEPTQPVQATTGMDRTQPHHYDGQADHESNPGFNQLNNKADKIEALAKARLYHPEDKNLKQEIYREVKEIIDRDPFLGYVDENTAAYKIYDHANEVLVIPKEREAPEPFPVQRPPVIRKAYRFLLWAVLGLIFSGLGAVILAPAAGLFAVQAASSESCPEDRVRAGLIIALAIVVFAVGIFLTYLFWLHWVG